MAPAGSAVGAVADVAARVRKAFDPRAFATTSPFVAMSWTEAGIVVRLACSWNLSAGRDAVIEATFHGTRGGASFRNVDGSFYDFVAECYDGTRTIPLASPPDAWGGRAAVAWARELAQGRRYDPEVERLVSVARVLDAIYGR